MLVTGDVRMRICVDSHAYKTPDHHRQRVWMSGGSVRVPVFVRTLFHEKKRISVFFLAYLARVFPFFLSLSRSLFLSFQATIMTFRERTRSARGREKKLDMHFVQIERRENKSRSDNKEETDETRLILRHSSSS